MHGAWQAAASAAAAAACMRACVAACVIDTIYELTRRRRPMRGDAPRARPKRTSKTGRYFHTKIRFSTPGLSAL
jgi:hypothetical protein